VNESEQVLADDEIKKMKSKVCLMRETGREEAFTVELERV